MSKPYMRRTFQALRELFRSTGRAASRATTEGNPGGKLADAADLLNPAFGSAFQARFDDGSTSVSPRKRWELCWLAQRCEDLYGSAPPSLSMLGLGVGREPLIYHFAHLAERVVATDLYDEEGAWSESRAAVEDVLTANPFPYPRERLSVRNMDMRSIDYPAQSFDVVWSCSSVEHVSTLGELVQVFREVHRVLKPGGHALITTEYSLDEPYFLPGVLSLWKDCGLFHGELEGLTLAGPVELRHADSFPGNRATSRRDVHRVPLLNDLTGGPSGTCIHVGYTRLTPVGFALRKTGKDFRWPELLNAPAWYREFSAGVSAFRDRSAAQIAADHFRRALEAASTPGARLHCFRYLIEACVHAGDVPALHAALRECTEAMPALPDDDDALDLIAYVAAGQGQVAFAQRCWERAHACPSALPVSRLRIRCNQLAAELKEHGVSTEGRHLSALADAAWCEALDFHGLGDPQIGLFQTRLASLRREYGLTSAIGAATAPPAAPASRAPVTPRNPDFDLASPPSRPIVYLGDHLALTRTVYGHKMQVDTRSQVGACFLLDGYWEEWIVRHLKDFVRPGMRALDVGANMGFYTLLLCDLVGPEGRVTAFEPWPAYYSILQQNVQLNGFDQRCTLVPRAVHECAGRQDLLFYENYGTGTLRGGEPFFEEHGNTHAPSLMQVEAVSIDEYLSANPQPVDFIKVDVDGSESFVFHGMRRLLGAGHPLTVFCEFCPSILRSRGVDPEGFLAELQDAGFDISWFAPEGIQRANSLGNLITADWYELLLKRG